MVLRALVVLLLAAIVLLAITLSARPAPVPDPCQTALDNLLTVQTATNLKVIAALQTPRRGSGMRLAVLQAKEARGFYAAMRVLLPLACQGDRYLVLDGQLAAETARLDEFIQKNW